MHLQAMLGLVIKYCINAYNEAILERSVKVHTILRRIYVFLQRRNLKIINVKNKIMLKRD